jgi:predicted AAA+ superfamily ATPase
VYLELIRRGYKVDIGKVKETEIDFVARKQDCIEYYQVSFTVNNSADTLNREIKPFASVNDHYQKYLITMDKDFVSDIDGIRKLYAVDWLLGS